MTASIDGLSVFSTMIPIIHHSCPDKLGVQYTRWTLGLDAALSTVSAMKRHILICRIVWPSTSILTPSVHFTAHPILTHHVPSHHHNKRKAECPPSSSAQRPRSGQDDDWMFFFPFILVDCEDRSFVRMGCECTVFRVLQVEQRILADTLTVRDYRLRTWES